MRGLFNTTYRVLGCAGVGDVKKVMSVFFSNESDSLKQPNVPSSNVSQDDHYQAAHVVGLTKVGI